LLVLMPIPPVLTPNEFVTILAAPVADEGQGRRVRPMRAEEAVRFVRRLLCCFLTDGRTRLPALLRVMLADRRPGSNSFTRQFD
jgi:hypothetical protein